MSGLAVFATVAGLVFLLLVVELIAATVPLIIVVTLVPPPERENLAQLLAAVDSSRRLRLWRALRLAVVARRLERSRNGRHEPGLWVRRDDARAAGLPSTAPAPWPAEEVHPAGTPGAPGGDASGQRLPAER